MKICFILNAPDDFDTQWADAPHLFHKNKRCFEYNMKKLKDIRTPITRLNVQHNNQKSANQDSDVAQRLQAHLYFFHG